MLSPDARYFYYRTPGDTGTERITEADVDHGYRSRTYIVPTGERPDRSWGGRLFMPQVRGDELDLAIFDFSDSGLSGTSIAGAVPLSTRVRPMGFAQDDSGLLYFARDSTAASDSLYLIDLRHGVHPAVPIPTSDGAVTVNAIWSPGASHRVARLTQSPIGKKDLSVVDVSGFLPSSPVSASGPGIVESVAWQPSWP
jgi:hypothetical protein